MEEVSHKRKRHHKVTCKEKNCQKCKELKVTKRSKRPRENTMKTRTETRKVDPLKRVNHYEIKRGAAWHSTKEGKGFCRITTESIEDETITEPKGIGWGVEVKGDIPKSEELFSIGIMTTHPNKKLIPKSSMQHIGKNSKGTNPATNSKEYREWWYKSRSFTVPANQRTGKSKSELVLYPLVTEDMGVLDMGLFVNSSGNVKQATKAREKQTEEQTNCFYGNFYSTKGDLSSQRYTHDEIFDLAVNPSIQLTAKQKQALRKRTLYTAMVVANRDICSKKDKKSVFLRCRYDILEPPE
jgi:hypothetical protein